MRGSMSGYQDIVVMPPIPLAAWCLTSKFLVESVAAGS